MSKATPASAFVALGDGRFSASVLTRGPWHPDHQHAGPPIALVAREIERRAAPLALTHFARLTTSLYRPVPIGELEVEVRDDYVGRNVAHFSASLSAGGKEVARCTAVLQREAPAALPPRLPGHPLPAAPRPVEESTPVRFPFDPTELGYQDLIDARVAKGDFFRGPCALWLRLLYPLLPDETPGPMQRAAVAADSGNGISAVLDFKEYVFVNSDLSIHLLRPPQGEWICIDARTLLGPAGGGIAEGRIYDTQGLVGRSTQSLTVRRRD